MSTYECTVKFGHLGAGHSWERSVRVRARDVLDAMRRAKRLPGAKKGRLSFSGASVSKVVLVA